VVGTGRSAITHGDGSFHLHALPFGSYTLRVERLGYRTVERAVDFGPDASPLLVEMEESAVDIAGLVVTGTLTERGADETLRPVNVLAGEELQRRLEETVAATLASEPGLTATSMGPATARPVIRGLSGDRVLLLEDGQRVGDVSNSGPDHATALDPASARRIEVVRGPGALLYGSNALGGVVNVIREEVPRDVVHDLHGTATLQNRTVNDSWGGHLSGTVPLADHVPLRFELSGRSSADLATPVGPLENTAIESLGGGAGASWVDDGWGSLGGAFRYHRNHYGIPGGFVGGHEEGVRVEMERSSTKAELHMDQGVGPFESLEADAVYTWYRHSEIEPPDILGTFFKRQAVSGELLARHGAVGPFTSGAVGGRASGERHDFGGSLDTPDARLFTAAAFLYQEMDLDPVVVEAGLRYDWSRVEPLQPDPESDIGNVRTRSFQAASGSVGLLYRATELMTLGASVARAFRTPDVNELYSEGPHLAAYSFEVGNPDLGTEVGTGVDVFVRLGSGRLQAELTGFHNRISGYVFPRETGDTSRTRLPVFQFSSEDAVLTGFETSLRWTVVPDLVVEGTSSFVRGTVEDTDEPLPLIPPFQGRIALEYARPGWFARAETRLAAEQDRLGAFETATDGYAVHNLAAGARVTLAGRLHVLTLTAENVTDQVYRNHLSRVKEIMPEAGRGITLTYRVVF
jgi:iron complex outermembrane receptor protein